MSFFERITTWETICRGQLRAHPVERLRLCMRVLRLKRQRRQLLTPNLSLQDGKPIFLVAEEEILSFGIANEVAA